MNPLFFSAAAVLLFSSAAVFIYNWRTASGPDAWRKPFVLYGVISLLASVLVRYFQAQYPDALAVYYGSLLLYGAALSRRSTSI